MLKYLLQIIAITKRSAMSCEEIFRKQLRQRGLRLTPQREMILVALHQIGSPASAEEIHSLVIEKSSCIELSTIYRTLDLLFSMNLVNVIDSGDKQRMFELKGNNLPHLHAVCKECGKIIGVELDLMQPFLDYLNNELHFSADLGNFNLQGLCAECAEAGLSVIDKTSKHA
jgi:Fur family transcriptional regulator, ferric uptake regulator